MTLLISVLVVIWNILVEIFEGSPRVETVEEVVEGLDLLLSAVLVPEFGYWLAFGETTFGFETSAPEFVECLLLFSLFLGRRFDIGGFVDGIELAALDGIEE
jgi:hypothetical protein